MCLANEAITCQRMGCMLTRFEIGTFWLCHFSSGAPGSASQVRAGMHANQRAHCTFYIFSSVPTLVVVGGWQKYVFFLNGTCIKYGKVRKLFQKVKCTSTVGGCLARMLTSRGEGANKWQLSPINSHLFPSKSHTEHNLGKRVGGKTCSHRRKGRFQIPKILSHQKLLQ